MPQVMILVYICIVIGVIGIIGLYTTCNTSVAEVLRGSGYEASLLAGAAAAAAAALRPLAAKEGFEYRALLAFTVKLPIYEPQSMLIVRSLYRGYGIFIQEKLGCTKGVVTTAHMAVSVNWGSISLVSL